MNTELNLETAYLQMGLDQLRLGNEQAAIKHFKMALALNPNNELLHACLAIALHDAKRLRAAKHEVEISLNLAPQSAFAHYAAGMINTSLADYKLAQTHFEQALALDSDDVNIYLGLARLYDLIGQKKAMLNILEAGLQKAPHDSAILASLGDYYLAVNKLDVAQRYAAQALQTDPESSSAHLLQGHIALRSNRLEEASQHALFVLQTHAGYAPALKLLCKIKTKRNRLLGIWWHYNLWMGRFSFASRLFILAGILILLHLSLDLLQRHGHVDLAGFVSLAWFSFCAYLWIGYIVFQRNLTKQLRQVKLNKNF